MTRGDDAAAGTGVGNLNGAVASPTGRMAPVAREIESYVAQQAFWAARGAMESTESTEGAGLGNEGKADESPAKPERGPSAGHTTDDLVGGRYRLHERLGSGGMGVVWRATDELLNRQVALKRIRLDLRTDETVELSRQRTLREARIAAQLHHPHVVSIFDVLTVDGDPWLVLEHLPSETLSKAIKSHGPPGPRVAAGVGVAIADGLAAAHRAGIVHRDVKPANVLLGRDGNVKLTDFGISHAIGDLTLTATGLITGTPAYLAPEVARGGESTAASDVYSLGATLYAAVEGVPPYKSDDNVFKMLQLVASGNVPPPQNAGELEPVLRRMLSREPAERPDAAEARELLREVLDGRPWSNSGSMPIPVLPPAPSRATASPLAARVPMIGDLAARRAALAVAAVLLVVFTIFLIVALT